MTCCIYSFSFMCSLYRRMIAAESSFRARLVLMRSTIRSTAHLTTTALRVRAASVSFTTLLQRVLTGTIPTTTSLSRIFPITSRQRSARTQTMPIARNSVRSASSTLRTQASSHQTELSSSTRRRSGTSAISNTMNFRRSCLKTGAPFY